MSHRNAPPTDRRVDAVLLDAAGTLIQVAVPVAHTYAAYAEAFGSKIETDALERAFGVAFADMPPMAFPEVEQRALETLEESWWRELVDRVLALAGAHVRDFDGYFKSLYAYYARSDAWVVFPEAVAVVSELSTRGTAVAVASNFDSRLNRILEDHGLSPHLSAVVHSTAVGAAKPDPAIFEHALARLGVRPRRAVHVGDSEHADYRGARNAGLSALLLDRFAVHAGTHVIANLEELLVWLDSRG